MMARALKVAAMPLLLYGCVAQPVVIDTPTAPRGHIAVQPGRAGFVIAAPHGTSDPQTGDYAAELARRTGFGLVVAAGFAVEPDAPGRPGRRFQVNRPFEGAPGRPPVEDVSSEAARQVYLAYEKRVQEAAQGRLAFYAEIHGNNRRESASRIEVATVGVDHDLALRLRTLFELIRDAHLRATPAAPRVEVLVEPADKLFYAATGSKRDGILRLPTRALHLELPRIARMEWREPYIAILAEFLAQAATLPAGR
jgi:hypothetical protein